MQGLQSERMFGTKPSFKGLGRVGWWLLGQASGLIECLGRIGCWLLEQASVLIEAQEDFAQLEASTVNSQVSCKEAKQEDASVPS